MKSTIWIPIVILAFFVTMYIVWKNVNGCAPQPILTTAKIVIDTTGAAALDTGKFHIEISETLCVESAPLKADASLITANNTEMVETISLIFSFATLMIVFVGIIFYMQLQKMESKIEKDVVRGIEAGQTFIRRLNGIIYDATIDQLQYSWKFFDVLIQLIDQSHSSSNPADSGNLVKEWRTRLEDELEKLKGHQARAFLMSQEYEDIDSGLNTLRTVRFDKAKTLEQLNFLYDYWNDFPPKEISIDDLQDIRKKLKSLRKYISDEISERI